ncbi:MAG: 3-deoxy-7-phosphoheptulonate synthase, partial [Clostridia bacterium]|nr:3-deoxy-7-phosphoheptulonate synthase [Clostridia bacterium]
SEDILKGIYAIRELHIKAIEAGGLSAADEMLYPANIHYVDDLLSYIAVGARSSENQLHRLVASGIDVPVGIKNPMGGSIIVMLNSIFAAQSGQVFKLNGWQVKTDGNPLAHAILRGAVDSYGNDIPNFHYETVMQVVEGYAKSGLKNPAIIIDANHSNSSKKFKQQIRICEEVMQNRLYDGDFKRNVKGFMIESFLEEGNQTEDKVYGKSITDPCLGWCDTERLILDIAEKV